MTANGAASTSVYPQEDEDGNKVELCLLIEGVKILNLPS